MLISESFRCFKAKQNNVQWSVSAISENNELVVSLWDQFFQKSDNGTNTYVDKVSRWSGLGNKEFIRNLTLAHKEKLKVRAVVAKSRRPDIVASGVAASSLGNTFHPKRDWLGKITKWDGDNFEIEFSKEK
jgi:hypothetical protein